MAFVSKGVECSVEQELKECLEIRLVSFEDSSYRLALVKLSELSFHLLAGLDYILVLLFDMLSQFATLVS